MKLERLLEREWYILEGKYICKRELYFGRRLERLGGSSKPGTVLWSNRPGKGVGEVLTEERKLVIYLEEWVLDYFLKSQQRPLSIIPVAVLDHLLCHTNGAIHQIRSFDWQLLNALSIGTSDQQNQSKLKIKSIRIQLNNSLLFYLNFLFNSFKSTYNSLHVKMNVSTSGWI